MPTINPRITVTLSPPLAACLKELSSLTRNSQSALIGDLLNESLPVFQRMTLVLRAAEKAKAEGMQIRREVGESLKDVQQRLESQLGLPLDATAMDGGLLLGELETVLRRGRASGSATRSVPAPDPEPRSGSTPISNRGVTPLPKAKKQQAKKAAQVEDITARYSIGDGAKTLLVRR